MKINLDQTKEIFQKEMIKYGLLEDNIKMDGKLHRCRAVRDRPGATSGAYFLKPDFPYNAFIQNFRTGYKTSFTIYNNHIDDVLIRKPTAISGELSVPTAVQNKMAYACYQFYHLANGKFSDLVANDYLVRKQVKPFSIKLDSSNNLIIPARDINGKIWTLQRIFPDGTKQFMSGGKKQGMLHKLGFKELPSEYDDYVYIAEGYATAASVYMATNKPTICAFDSGNLVHVGKIIKKRWKHAQLAYCADVDYIGIKKAIEAVTQTGGHIILPNPPTSSNEGFFTDLNDFNDLHCEFGIDRVCDSIIEQLEFKRSLMKQSYELYTDQISFYDINPIFWRITRRVIANYFVKEDAKRIAKSSLEEQMIEIFKFNELYHDELKNEVSKLHEFMGSSTKS